MFKPNLKTNNKSLEELKSSLPCYGASEHRFFESQFKINGSHAIFDFGHKHKLKVPNLKIKDKKLSLGVSKVKDFETPYNDILCDFDSYRRIQTDKELLGLFKEKFELKSFLKGRILNITKRGFSVGIGGIVGFLSSNNTVKVNKDKSVIVYIESININQGIISFSQKNIHKKTHKILLKLASRIVFIFESNSKKN